MVDSKTFEYLVLFLTTNEFSYFFMYELSFAPSDYQNFKISLGFKSARFNNSVFKNQINTKLLNSNIFHADLAFIQYTN